MDKKLKVGLIGLGGIMGYAQILLPQPSGLFRARMYPPLSLKREVNVIALSSALLRAALSPVRR